MSYMRSPMALIGIVAALVLALWYQSLGDVGIIALSFLTWVFGVLAWSDIGYFNGMIPSLISSLKSPITIPEILRQELMSFIGFFAVVILFAYGVTFVGLGMYTLGWADFALKAIKYLSYGIVFLIGLEFLITRKWR